MASAAVAGPYEDALPKFAADSYSDTEAAIGAVAGSGHPLSLKLVEALRDGQLLIAGGQVYHPRCRRQVSSMPRRARPPNPPQALKPVRLNNRVRRAVEAALGSLTLLSSDAGTRLDAARAVFRSRDAAALPTLEQAIAQESDGHVKAALERPAPPSFSIRRMLPLAENVSAVETLQARGNQDALALLHEPAGRHAGRRR